MKKTILRVGDEVSSLMGRGIISAIRVDSRGVALWLKGSPVLMPVYEEWGWTLSDREEELDRAIKQKLLKEYGYKKTAG
jgi:hypothetical protein